MPSRMMDLRGLSSSSFFSDDVCFPIEGQTGLWKAECRMDQHANGKSVTPSHLERIIPAEYQTNESLGLCLDSHALGAERAPDQSSTFLGPMDSGRGIKSALNGQQASYFAEGKKVDMMASEYENNLFSSSLSELFSRKLRLSSHNSLYAHSFDTVASHCEEEEPFESLDEIEAQTIGNLLPNDDDLFSGVTGGLEMTIGPNCREESEELDLFSSVGGMDLGDDSSSVKLKGVPAEVSDGQLGLCNGAVVGEHGLYGHPSGSPNNRTSGFSVAHASNFSSSMDNRTILGVNSAIGAPFREPTFHFSTSSSISNSLSSSVAESANFQGQLKFDVPAAPTFHPNSLPEYQDDLSRGIHCNSSTLVAANINVKHPEIIGNRALHRVSSNGHAVEFKECGFTSLSNGSHLFSGHPYSWSNSYHPPPPGMMWPQPPSIVNGICAAHSPGRLHGLPRTPSHMVNTVLPLNNHHVGSAPTVNASLWDRHHISAGESSDASGFHPGSLGSVSKNSPHTVEYISPNIFPHVGGNHMDLSMHQKHVGFQSLHPRLTMFSGRGQVIPMVNSVDCPHERARSRRNEGSVNQADKKQYELDIDHIIRGEDKRTTLMIKNIPNKYTSKMLLAAIDECHRGTYDFIYLPIDFKNKCNVGYAFINMIEPSHIIPFYQAFNGKKWEKFNSEKVASLAYARIQGKAALIAHFQNSSLMNEDKRCRPILFNTEGPNAGDQVPFPMGVNVRTRPGKPRSNLNDEYHQESTTNLANGENLSNEETCSEKE
ncbi:hypothetical protein SLA2020_201540 [Shorea laevis]